MILTKEKIALEIHVKIVSNQILAAAEDDVDNAKLQFECKNLIGDLDGIQDESYQVKQKCGLIYDRSDDVNLPPLPP